MRCLLAALLLSLLSFHSPAALVLKDLAGKNRNIDEYIGRGDWSALVVWSAVALFASVKCIR